MNLNYAVLDAPSNLGLRPPETGCVPGVYKLAGTLRDQNLLQRLRAADAGVVTAPRYQSIWKQGSGTRNTSEIGNYSLNLAKRVNAIIDSKALPIVLGGDCSILIGCALALKQRGRYGLVFIDGHSDFRHPGNSEQLASAAGEDLAIVTGRGDSRLINVNNAKPYLIDNDIAIAGIRPHDEYIAELKRTDMTLQTSQNIVQHPQASTNAILNKVLKPELDGFWVHLDLDVLDAQIMPAVDTPEADGLSYSALCRLLQALINSHALVGINITIYDPDLDPDLQHAKNISDMLVQALMNGDT